MFAHASGKCDDFSSSIKNSRTEVEIMAFYTNYVCFHSNTLVTKVISNQNIAHFLDCIFLL